jgi:hypothetical protein
MLKIPVVVGKNRLRGNGKGAMVFDDFSQDNLSALRNVLREEAKAKEVEPTPDWLRQAVGQILKLYEEAFNQWQLAKNETVGFVYEACMPSGGSVLLGDPIVLARIRSQETHPK